MTRPNRRGAVLLLVAVLLVVATAVAAAVMTSAIRAARQVRLDARALQADHLAEAGLARAAVRLAADPDYTGEEWAADLPGGESAGVVIRVDRDAATITATATFPAGAERPARTTLKRSLAAPGSSAAAAGPPGPGGGDR